MTDDVRKAAEPAKKADAAAAHTAPQTAKLDTVAIGAEAATQAKADEKTPPAAKAAPLRETTSQPAKAAAARRTGSSDRPQAKPAPSAQIADSEKSPAGSGTAGRTKEFTMSNTDFTRTIADALSEVQTRAKEAYEKSTEVAGEANELAKGNIEAITESGRIFSSGIQDMSKSYLDEARNAFETLTADLKEIAAAKSPTELFQLQGKLMRRNFDSMVAFGSRNSEAMVKLANETMAPISSRMSVAADKVSKATV